MRLNVSFSYDPSDALRPAKWVCDTFARLDRRPLGFTTAVLTSTDHSHATSATGEEVGPHLGRSNDARGRTAEPVSVRSGPSCQWVVVSLDLLDATCSSAV
jgi:hypothetical protein